MVLAGEVDPTGRQLADGVVEAAMAETQLIGIGTVSQSKDLMAHANTEDRVLLLQFSHHILYPRDGFRVPGAVRKHDAVGRQARTRSAEMFHGTTVTAQPRLLSSRKMECLRPKSKSTTLRPPKGDG